MQLLYAELGLKEREEKLRSEARKQENRSYMRSLQQSEIENERSKYSSSGSEKKKLKKELENIMKDYKERISNIDARMDESLEKIETGKVTITGTLFGLADYINKRMLWRDKFGELIDSRDLLPDEMQLQMPFGGKADPKKAVNPALADLPTETAEALQAKTNDYNAKKKLEETTEEVLPVEHSEEGWETATDVQLIKQYGTVDMSKVRKMVLFEDKYIIPGGTTPLTPAALQSTVNTDPEAEKTRQEAVTANASKNRNSNKNKPK